MTDWTQGRDGWVARCISDEAEFCSDGAIDVIPCSGMMEHTSRNSLVEEGEVSRLEGGREGVYLIFFQGESKTHARGYEVGVIDLQRRGQGLIHMGHGVFEPRGSEIGRAHV